MAPEKFIKKYCIEGKLHNHSPAAQEEIFIGLAYDGKHHLLGCRPIGMDYILKDAEQSKESWGMITFPEGIKTLEEMTAGQKFTTECNSTTIQVVSSFSEIKYIFS